MNDPLTAPPHNIEAEAAFIGGVMRVAGRGDIDGAGRALALVGDADIYGDRNRRVFAVLRDLVKAGTSPDVATVADALRRKGSKVEDVDALPGLMEAGDGSANVEQHARLVRRCALERRATKLTGDLVARIGTGADLTADADALRVALGDLAGEDGGRSARRGPRRIEDLRAEAEALAALPSIPCCVPGLDVGYRPGHLIIPAAFTGEGKTTLLRAEARARTAAGSPVLYVSAELSGVELANGLPDVRGLQIVDDTPGTPAALVAEVERWARGLGDAAEQPYVLIDFLQRFRAEDRTGYRVVGESAEAVQRVTRRLGIVTIAAAQLSRASKDKDGPKVHHLREAGELEQVADLVLLLSKIGDDRLRVEVGKNRWGLSGQEVEVGVDFATATLRAITQADVYRPLARKVETYLVAHGGRAAVRDLQNNVRWNSSHPNARDIEMAAGTGLFILDGNEAHIPGVDVSPLRGGKPSTQRPLEMSTPVYMSTATGENTPW